MQRSWVAEMVSWSLPASTAMSYLLISATASPSLLTPPPPLEGCTKTAATPSSTGSTACVSRSVGRLAFAFFGRPPSSPLASPPTAAGADGGLSLSRAIAASTRTTSSPTLAVYRRPRPPTQRFFVHDRPTRESQNPHISVRQQNPMRRHVCCRCGSRAQSVRPPRVGRCGGGDGGVTTALRRPAVCHIREKDPPHRTSSPWLRGAGWERTAAQRSFAVATRRRVERARRYCKIASLSHHNFPREILTYCAA